MMIWSQRQAGWLKMRTYPIDAIAALSSALDLVTVHTKRQ